MKNNLWVWGCVLDTVPGNIQFAPGQHYCSLETAADFIGADNVVLTNTVDNAADSLNERIFAPLAGKSVVCILQHSDYRGSAEAISRFSQTHPNITGAMIDDFLDYRGNYYRGPSAGMKPEELKAIREALKKYNPDLKLYVVRYSRENMDELIPYLDYFDVLSFWCWVSTRDFWEAHYSDTVAELQTKYDKPIIQGIFLHHYGIDATDFTPMSLDLLKLQCRRVAEELRPGHIDGVCVLSNGWFDRDSHREQVQFVRDYFAWVFGTWTRR